MAYGPGMHPGIRSVVARMDALEQELAAESSTARHFLATYRRVTLAVGAAAEGGGIEDSGWLDRWDVAFADLYVDALQAHRRDPASPAAPWRAAFAAPAGLHPYLHVLLGMNAHINYDMPQSLLRVLSDDDFADPVLMASRGRDHHALDAVIVAMVPGEAARLARAGAEAPRALDRLLMPVNRAASGRLLRESRGKVWANTQALQRARTAGPESYETALARLEVLSAARVADLLRPGSPLLRVATRGFGVRLPSAVTGRP